MYFERCVNAKFIPRKLLEQLPDKSFDADVFYDFLGIALQSPSQMLYLLMSEENVIQGFLWCEVNALEKILFVNTLSVDKSLWNRGETVKFSIEFLKEMFNKLNLNKVIWATNRPAMFLKLGFKKSDNILLEYTGE